MSISERDAIARQAEHERKSGMKHSGEERCFDLAWQCTLYKMEVSTSQKYTYEESHYAHAARRGLLLGSETHTYVNLHSTDTPLLPHALLLRVTGYKAAVC